MIVVQIEGSTGTPYTATFSREGNNLKTSCTCPAGESRMHCKHRLALFDGDITQVRGDAPPDLARQIAEMLQGTDVAQALAVLADAERAAEAAKADLKRATKALDRVMHS